MHPLALAHPSFIPGHIGRIVDHVKDEIKEEGHHLRDGIVDESHHLKEETQEALSHHPHLQTKQRIATTLPDTCTPDQDDEIQDRGSDDDGDDNDGEASWAPTFLALHMKDDEPALDGTLDNHEGNTEHEVLVPSKAKRLSRMYQACVYSPVSPNVNAEDESTARTQNAIPREDRTLQSHERFLTVPAPKGDRDGAVVRRFPSVTVVDDRKGHWRSISLISAQSGKSLRNSTNDLLDLIVKAENAEREKLMKAAEDDGQRTDLTTE
ncbi:hypothetical protein AAFC00_003190 [Neodothiora populina]